jgi:hypothetical protein
MAFPDVPKFLRKAAEYAAFTMGLPGAAREALRARLRDVRRESAEDLAEAAAAEALLAELDAAAAEAEARGFLAIGEEESDKPAEVEL